MTVLEERELPYRYPMSPYPTGWYVVAESKDVQPGDVKPIRYFGKELVLFRTESGTPAVLDAYCPHLGAHLGHGGTVEGDSIRCPFHSWRFDAETGQVDEIPYKATPGLPDVSAACWPVEEVSGLILLWFSEHGHAPTWRVPEQPDFGAPGWVGYETTSWTVRVHVQDVAENIPDTTHFVSVHGLAEYPTAHARTEGHVYHQVMGDDAFALRHEVYGLGLSRLDIESPRYRFIVATTPIDEQYVDLRLLFLIYEGEGSTEISKKGQSIMGVIVKNTALDVNIWSHKAYHERPQLVAGDGPIGVMRKWAKQFYETA